MRRGLLALIFVPLAAQVAWAQGQCDCCSGSEWVQIEALPASGICGALRNYQCSNAPDRLCPSPEIAWNGTGDGDTDGDWTPTGQGGELALAAHAGTFGWDTTYTTAGQQTKFERDSPFDPDQQQFVTFWMNPQLVPAGSRLRVYWQLTVQQGQTLNVANYTNGFPIGVWQQVTIPMADFGIAPDKDVRKLHFVYGAKSGQRYYFDDIQLVPHADACDLGPCLPQLSQCSGDFTVSCVNDEDCRGVCEDQHPVDSDIACNAFGLGGGQLSAFSNSPLPHAWKTVLRRTSCDGATGEMQLGRATLADTGDPATCSEGRKCAGGEDPCLTDADCGGGTCETRCVVIPPVPLVALGSCAVVEFYGDASGTMRCDGSLGSDDLSLPWRIQVHLPPGGDIVPSLPGDQPCPVCLPFFGAGLCLGGPNHGGGCTPRVHFPGLTYQPSLDCLPDPAEALPGPTLSTRATNAPVVLQAVDMPQEPRVFCGFCRDHVDGGSGCFEGDPNPSCPPSQAIRPCQSDADCVPPFESCAQRDPGANSRAEITEIFLAGQSTEQCIADPAGNEGVYALTACVPPTFDPLFDAVLSLPGPFDGTIRVDVSRVPSP